MSRQNIKCEKIAKKQYKDLDIRATQHLRLILEKSWVTHVLESIWFNILVIKAKAIIGKLFLKNLKVKYIEWTTHHINNLHVKS